MGLLKIEEKNIQGTKIENILHDSSSLLKSSYNYNTQQLTLTFVKSGGVYLYNAVPNKIYENFKSAKSTGVYFHAEIKNKYTTVNNGEVPKEQLNLIVEEINNLKKELKS